MEPVRIRVKATKFYLNSNKRLDRLWVKEAKASFIFQAILSSYVIAYSKNYCYNNHIYIYRNSWITKKRKRKGMEHMDPNAGQPANSGRAKKVMLVTLIVIVVLGVGAYAGMHYTSRPQFCATCHEIAPQAASYENSPHANAGVECLDCHAKPGTLGYIKRKVASYKEVYEQVTNQVPAKIEWTPHLDSCLDCHSGKNSKFPNARNITLTSGPNAPAINHKPMLDASINCLGCHQKIGHSQKV